MYCVNTAVRSKDIDNQMQLVVYDMVSLAKIVAFEETMESLSSICTSYCCKFCAWY